MSRKVNPPLVRPEIVAHRGASGDFPEHTLTAYRAAFEQGADAVECDVRLTADGHLVCVHDRRVDRTSNGTGAVSSSTLPALAALDWATWRSPGLDGRLLTLRGLLDAVRDCGRSVTVAIEAKHPTRSAGRVERELAAVLAEYGWDGRDGLDPPVRVMSFSTTALYRMRSLAPGVPLVKLVNERVPWRIRRGYLPAGIQLVGINIAALRRHPEYVRHWQDRGHRVHVFTVDDPADLQLCQELGVDTVITNYPGRALRALA